MLLAMLMLTFLGLGLVAHGIEPTRTRAHGRVNREKLADIDRIGTTCARCGLPMAGAWPSICARFSSYLVTPTSRRRSDLNEEAAKMAAGSRGAVFESVAPVEAFVEPAPGVPS